MELIAGLGSREESAIKHQANLVPVSPSIRFAEAARTLGRVARYQGLKVPTFRSPPGLTGVQRTIQRWEPESTVSVVVRGRPWPAVVADMVEGVVVANRLDSVRANAIRSALWQALDEPAIAA